MTEEEAIDILRNAAWLGTESELAELEEAVNMACKALEFVTINNNSDEIKVTNRNEKDTIYRQVAIDALIERDPNCGIDSAEVIKELPSAQPELIEKTAYIRGFEQGRTQGMIDAQERKK